MVVCKSIPKLNFFMNDVKHSSVKVSITSLILSRINACIQRDRKRQLKLEVLFGDASEHATDQLGPKWLTNFLHTKWEQEEARTKIRIRFREESENQIPF